MNLEPIKDLLKQHVIVVVSILSFVVVVLLYKPQPKAIKTSEAKKSSTVIRDDIDQKTYLARLEKNYYDTQEVLKSMQEQLATLEKNKSKDKNNIRNKEFSRLVKEAVSAEFDHYLEDKSVNTSIQSKSYALAIANIVPVKNSPSLYIPLGSFCKGTLLTGVYAIADEQNPLPVLIRLDEAFYGPNNRRIPMKGAFLLGKAYGDLVSQRALIQIIAISTVLENGDIVEKEMDLGYLTDQEGELGIKGKMINNTGKQLALAFMSGFASGAAEGVADTQVSSRETESGTVIRNVTGSVAKKALFDGLSKSTGDLSNYFSKKAETVVPAIHIKNGQSVYFILQKGVSIDATSQVRFDNAFAGK